MLGESVSKGSIAYLDESTLKTVPVKEDTLKKARNVAEKHIKGIMNKEFSPGPSRSCKACDYGEICRLKGK